MATIVRRAEQHRFPNRTVRFEGRDHGSDVSLFLIDNEPGEGPDLHVHPSPETWVVRSGQARFMVGTDSIEAGPGDIVVVEAGTPHGFRNIGTGRLELTCIHASDRIVQEWV